MTLHDVLVCMWLFPVNVLINCIQIVQSNVCIYMYLVRIHAGGPDLRFLIKLNFVLYEILSFSVFVFFKRTLPLPKIFCLSWLRFYSMNVSHKSEALAPLHVYMYVLKYINYSFLYLICFLIIHLFVLISNLYTCKYDLLHVCF